MEAEDTEAASTSTSPEHASEVATGEGRPDDRNEEIDESPVPDPTAKQPGAGDDPEAD